VLKLLTITGTLCALLLSGCGGGGGSGSTAVNEGKAVNSLGYYGDGVMFGSKPIIGDWEVGYPCYYHTFKSDGAVTIDYSYFEIPLLVYTYGVNADGTQLTILKSSYAPNDTKEVYTIESMEANCSKVRQLIYRNDSLEDNISMQFCTRLPAATLEPISNAGETSNTLGFYGEGVKLGNELISGKWVADGLGEQWSFEFDSNGTVFLIESNQFSYVKRLKIATYGIIEDGKMVFIGNSGNPFLEITGLSEGCYRANDGYNEYKLCKSAIDDNNTTWLGGVY